MTLRPNDKAFTDWLHRLRGGKNVLDRLDEKIIVGVRQRMQTASRLEETDPDLSELEADVTSAAREEGLFEATTARAWKVPSFASGVLAATAVWVLVLAAMPWSAFVDGDEGLTELPKVKGVGGEKAEVSQRFQLELHLPDGARPGQLAGKLASIGYVRLLELSSEDADKLIFIATDENLESYNEVLSEYGQYIEESGLYILEVK